MPRRTRLPYPVTITHPYVPTWSTMLPPPLPKMKPSSTNSEDTKNNVPAWRRNMKRRYKLSLISSSEFQVSYMPDPNLPQLPQSDIDKDWDELEVYIKQIARDYGNGARAVCETVSTPAQDGPQQQQQKPTKQRRWRMPLSCYHPFHTFLSSDTKRRIVDGIPPSQLAIASLGRATAGRSCPTPEDLSSNLGLPLALAEALAPWQRTGVDFVSQRGGRALIADEMGLGKTIQAIASMTCYPDEWPVLVVCPSSARYHWEAEFVHWLGVHSPVHQKKGAPKEKLTKEEEEMRDEFEHGVKKDDDHGGGGEGTGEKTGAKTRAKRKLNVNGDEADDDGAKKSRGGSSKSSSSSTEEGDEKEKPSPKEPMHLLHKSQIHVVASSRDAIFPRTNIRVVICSYGLATNLIASETIRPKQFQCVIVDESHFLKSKSTKRTQTILPVLKAASRVIMLSGTPALSKPYELYPQLSVLGEAKGWWDDEEEFIEKYVKPTGSIRGGGGDDNKDSAGADRGGDTNAAIRANPHLSELHALLTSTVMIRRLKNDCLKSLPPKVRIKAHLTVEHEQLRNEISNYMVLLRQGDGVLAQLARAHDQGLVVPPPRPPMMVAQTPNGPMNSMGPPQQGQQQQQRLPPGQMAMERPMMMAGRGRGGVGRGGPPGGPRPIVAQTPRGPMNAMGSPPQQQQRPPAGQTAMGQPMMMAGRGRGAVGRGTPPGGRPPGGFVPPPGRNAPPGGFVPPPGRNAPPFPAAAGRGRAPVGPPGGPPRPPGTNAVAPNANGVGVRGAQTSHPPPASNQDFAETARKAVLNQLFCLTGNSKIPMVVTMLKQWLDDPTKGKLCVFAHHVNVLDGITAGAGLSNEPGSQTKFIRIDGSTTPKKRQDQITTFQSDPTVRIAILGITAAGVAVTLTACSTVWFAELFWTPAVMIQAEDRCHRIGQQANVRCMYVIAKGTLDDLLWKLIEKKFRDLGEFVEGKEKQSMVVHETCGDEILKRPRRPTKEDETNEGLADLAEMEAIRHDIEELGREEQAMVKPPGDADEDDEAEVGGDAATSTGSGSESSESEQNELPRSLRDILVEHKRRGAKNLCFPGSMQLPRLGLYKMFFDGPTYGITLVYFQGRAIVIKADDDRGFSEGPDAKPRIGDILVSVNRKQLDQSAPFPEILTKLKNAMEKSIVELLFAACDEFSSFFCQLPMSTKETFPPQLLTPSSDRPNEPLQDSAGAESIYASV